MSVFLTESLMEILQVTECQTCRVVGFAQSEVAYTFFYDVAKMSSIKVNHAVWIFENLALLNEAEEEVSHTLLPPPPPLVHECFNSLEY